VKDDAFRSAEKRFKSILKVSVEKKKRKQADQEDPADEIIDFSTPNKANAEKIEVVVVRLRTENQLFKKVELSPGQCRFLSCKELKIFTVKSIPGFSKTFDTSSLRFLFHSQSFLSRRAKVLDKKIPERFYSQESF
jgi:hypothetical protein